jgi:tetratricopeptide (TPR) repeat protein
LLYLEGGEAQAAAGLIARAIQQRPDVPAFYNTLGNAFRGLRRLDTAAQCFRKAISLDPRFAEAVANLGSALEECGQADEAVLCHRRALELKPDCAEIHGNLGNALRSAGSPEEARAAYETALRLRPDYAEGWMNLGNLDFDRGRYAQAEQHYRRAVGLNSRLHAAKSNLGAALAQLGNHREAETWCLEAVQANPGDAAAQCNLASIWVMTGRPEEAERLCRQALASDPAMPAAHTNLGLALTRLHRFEEAEAHCRAALQMSPGRPAGHAHLARILQLTGRFEESELWLRRGLELAPEHERLLGGMGDFCVARVDLDGALCWYDRCIEMAPEWGLALAARSMVRLAMGDFERGWEEYEFRWKLADCPPPEFSQPQWDGEPFPGRTLLLHAEQGLGDTLQFVRFASLAKRLGGRVVLASQPALAPILAGVAGVDVVVGNDGELPAFDCHLPLMSLPRVLKTGEDAMQRQIPYLKVPPRSSRIARERLARIAPGGPRIGIAWAGNRKHPNDVNRSMDLDLFAPLLAIPGVRWLSLQQGRAIPTDLPLAPAIADDDPIDITAAIVAELDLVITVDSMIAHLAGALGRPVWTLLPFAADWRWMTGREDSPWYPTMRLFRQPRFGAWDEVVGRVAAELAARIAETSALRQSSPKAAPGSPDMDISGRKPVAAPAGRRKIQPLDKG